MVLARVTGRVKMGGHSVPDETVTRRYQSGLKNFFKLYRPLADTWRIYDAAGDKGLSIIAHGEREIVTSVDQPDVWRQIQEKL